MGISLAQMRQYVWDYFELDAEDLSAALIDRWADEAFSRVYRAVKRWPHYEATETIGTESGVKEYVPTLAQVHSIYGPDGQLKWWEHTEAQRRYDTLGQQAAADRPQGWSVWGGTLVLWPTPNSDYALTAYGWREPLGFSELGAGAEPDLPEDFHQAVLSWVMHRAYQHQDDFEGAQLEAVEFGTMLDLLSRHETQAPTAAPVSLGGNRRRRNTIAARQRYPWEGGV